MAMNWLSGWLGQIVVIILLATIIDLLLPSRSLERYVKLVVSLFILVALLSPIVQFFKEDFYTKLMQDPFYEASFSDIDQGANVTATKSLAAIKKDGLKMKQEREKQTMKIVEGRVESLIKEQIETHVELEVVDIRASVEVNSEGIPDVQEVNLTLKTPTLQLEMDSSSRESSYKGLHIEPVQAVQRVKVETKKEKKQKEEVSFEQQQVDMWNEKLDHIFKLLAQNFNLARHQVSIEWDRVRG